MAFTERMTEDLQCFFEIKTSILTSFLGCVQHRQIVQGNRNIGVSLTQLLLFIARAARYGLSARAGRPVAW